MLGLQVDVNDPVSLARMSSDLRTLAPRLNVVLANAGLSQAEDMASDDWTVDAAEAIVQTNILGVLRRAQAVLPLIKGQPGATFMATSSALAFVPRTDFPAYCASKAFLHSWLQSLRHQLRASRVDVLELSPPYVQTELTGASQASDPRAMPVDAYVAQALRILESGATPRGELVLEPDLPRRCAERDGRYDAVFAALNPD